ncbi:hypothetical protein LINGRAHAP2_LOCUS18413 [Linum grandiflorum]
MCANYDPKATPESIKNDPNIKDICETTEKPAECFDFLGNSPKANPVYAIKDDVPNLRRMVMEIAAQISQDPPAEVKTSFDTCAQNFNDVGKRLLDVEASCTVCSQHNDKCPAEEVTKITTALNSGLSNLDVCDKALDTTTSGIKKCVEDATASFTDSINQILEVSKKLNQ